VGRTHLAITVELVHGVHTGDLWPRPGRVLIASRSVTFEQLAAAIDDAFARWDRSHLHEFTLADGTVITPHRWWDGEEPDGSLDGAKTRLGRLRLSEQFAYVFDLGDNWQHLCTVGPKLADPLESLGTVPDRPLPCWGWGDIPDQYGRRWNGDDGSTPMPPTPDGMADLPPILPWWGPQRSRGRQASLPSGEVTEIRHRDLIT
jgi:Plasmid pRiA4b ORF-3-like protein